MIEFITILALIDLHHQTMAEVFYNVSRRTIRNWQAQSRKITFTAEQLCNKNIAIAIQ